MSLQQYLKVVICFIVLTDLTKFLLKFCVDEVFEDRGAINMRRIKKGKSSSLGMPKAPQVNISRILKHLSLGMPGWHAIFLLQQLAVYLDFCFVHMTCVFCVYFTFLFLYTPCYYEIILHWFIECFICFTYHFWVWPYSMLFVLHLNFLSMVL